MKVKEKIPPERERNEILNGFYQSCLQGINMASPPKDFLSSIGLDHSRLNHLAFASGQGHHGKSEDFKNRWVSCGLLTPSDAPVREEGMTAYTPFGSYGIIFPMRNQRNEIVNFYAYRFKVSPHRGEYLCDEGLYPAHPSLKTTRLFLCETMIDAASLIQAEALENRDAVIALKHGELTDDIRTAIRSLAELGSLVVLAKDENKEVMNELTRITSAKVTAALLADGDSLNDMLLKYGGDGVLKFIEEITTEKQDASGFFQISESEFFYKGKQVSYHIHGMVSTNPQIMQFDFEIESHFDGSLLNVRIDLQDYRRANERLYFFTEGKQLDFNLMLLELEQIRNQLDGIRREQAKRKTTGEKGFSVKADKVAKNILRAENLFSELDQLIEKSGVIGENKNRLLLYLIAGSFKFKKCNLHAVIHASDISSGSELARKIAGLIPENDTYHIELTSSRTFRYFGNTAIHNKCIVIPDYSGVTSNHGIHDLKRLQAQGSIVNDAPVKGADGYLSTVKQEVKGHTSSIGACVNSKKFFEGEPRTVLVGMDHSKEQIRLLMDHDCRIMAGEVDFKEQEEAKEVLRYVIRNLGSLETVNPFSSALMLPQEIGNARMLSMQLHCFVSLITLFNQHQRQRDASGRVITQKEDVKIGTDLFLDSIMVNVDEIDAGTRDFFNRFKALLLAMPQKREAMMSSLEIQKALNISKSHANRFLKTLLSHEYIQKEGHRNMGFSYRIRNWDELDPVKEMIQGQLGGFGEPNPDGSPDAA